MECVRLHLTSINLKQKTTGRGRPVVIKAFMLFTERKDNNTVYPIKTVCSFSISFSSRFLMEMVKTPLSSFAETSSSFTVSPT